MIRTLLTTSAIALALSTTVIAQDNAAPVAPAETPATPAEAPAVPAAGAQVDTGAAETTEIDAPWDMSAGYVAADSDNLGSQLMGAPVYSSATDDAEQVGTINDIVFSAQGDITAVVVGVGGFLGIGEKSVAVDFQSLEFALAADNTERWVLPTTAEALTAAPDFVWAEDAPVDGAAPAAPPADAMAPAAPAQ
ncbi:MAG: hypothetical protein ABS75_19200 [Pelagibacterium sp. SCN 63-23]|nr:MAG: hypothetical protein ABS75_19200 [Pelagibacterium sp. SCN 63-23]